MNRTWRSPLFLKSLYLFQVTLCLYALGRTTQKHSDYTGPVIGPKMAEKNERNFTEEQIKAGRDANVGLQVSRVKDWAWRGCLLLFRGNVSPEPDTNRIVKLRAEHRKSCLFHMTLFFIF